MQKLKLLMPTPTQLAASIAATGSALLCPPAFAQNATNGAALYAQNCADSTCHGPQPIRNVNKVLNGANNATRIGQEISRGTGGMNILQGKLTTAQLQDIAAYLANPLATPAPSPSPSPTPPPAPAPVGVISLDKTSASLVATPVGSVSALSTIRVSNATTSATTITNISSSSPDFIVQRGCLSALPAQGACLFGVSFAPRSATSLSATVTVSFANGNTLQLPVSGAGTPKTTPTTAGKVVEYYNPDLDHYFITSGTSEQGFIDSGGVGRWLRTGSSFGATGSVQVCRFYGNGATNPATKSIYGPNSHFYTADKGECDFLKSSFNANAKSWSFENLDYSTTLPVNGTCANGLVPIYRAYNNGFAQNIDSNHRLTTDKAGYDALLTLGWAGEGVAMCATP